MQFCIPFHSQRTLLTFRPLYWFWLRCVAITANLVIFYLVNSKSYENSAKWKKNQPIWMWSMWPILWMWSNVVAANPFRVIFRLKTFDKSVHRNLNGIFPKILKWLICQRWFMFKMDLNVTCTGNVKLVFRIQPSVRRQNSLIRHNWIHDCIQHDSRMEMWSLSHLPLV